MEVRIYDEDAENKYITMDEFLEHMRKEDSKKNFRNWINKTIPHNGTSYNTYYVLLHPREILLEWKRQIKYAWQRVFRGWDDRVVWSIDYHLSEMLPQWLEKLRDNKQGTPMEMFDGLPYEDEENYTYSEESWSVARQRWDTILDEMILGFQIYAKDNWFTEDSDDKKKFDRAMELFVKYFQSLWD